MSAVNKTAAKRVKYAPQIVLSHTRLKPEHGPRVLRSALRLPKVIDRTGLSRASIYRFVGQGKFPAPSKLSERVSVWDSEAIDAWLADKFGSAS